MAQHNELGHIGEDKATDYLRSKGHKIIDRNWRFAGYELDIISRDREFIVFTEVKTRSSDEWGDPEDFVDARRMRRMVEAADYYLKFNKIDDPARFDIIAVLRDNDSFIVEHFEDAFIHFLSVFRL